jgi:hypothetical protein
VSEWEWIVRTALDPQATRGEFEERPSQPPPRLELSKRVASEHYAYVLTDHREVERQPALARLFT